jgi:hypothetical protein
METYWENEIMENQVWILLWNKNQGKLGRKKKMNLKTHITSKEKIVKLIRSKTKQEAKQLQIKVRKYCKILILILKISFRLEIIIFQL